MISKAVETSATHNVIVVWWEFVVDECGDGWWCDVAIGARQVEGVVPRYISGLP